MFSVSNDQNMRWFCCTDQARIRNTAISAENHSKENGPFIFGENSADSSFRIDFDRINLYQFDFDRGTAVIEEFDNLFKMAR